MDVRTLHRWGPPPREALDLQKKLRERAVPEDRLGAVRPLARLDVHADPRQETARAAASLLSFPALKDPRRGHGETAGLYCPNGCYHEPLF